MQNIFSDYDTKDFVFKRELGEFQIYFRKIPCINKNFWCSVLSINSIEDELNIV